MLTCPAVGGDYSLNEKHHNKLSCQCQQEETVFRRKNQKVHGLYKFSGVSGTRTDISRRRGNALRVKCRHYFHSSGTKSRVISVTLGTRRVYLTPAASIMRLLARVAMESAYLSLR